MKGIRNAEIIAVGSELLTPLRTDTNSLYLTRMLNELGIELRRKTVVGDSVDDLVDAIKEGMRRADLLITVGGLGPTEDDRTREAVAKATGRALVRSQQWVDYLTMRFQRAGRKLTSNNLQQADLLDGAELLENAVGSAPGQWIDGACAILMLPGPPREVVPMFEKAARPRISALLAGGAPILTRVLRVTGITESHTDSLIGSIYRDLLNPSVTILASPGSIELHIRATAGPDRPAEVLIREIEREFRDRLGDRVYGADGETLETVVAGLLVGLGQSIATAESCTGGLLASRLTEVPGSSAYFLRGLVCYSNQSKTDELGVGADLIAEHGAVSPQVAEAMASGARRAAGADYGIGITGVAGPSGGTEAKPVGLVYVSLAGLGRTETTENRFLGERALVRFQATQRALDMLRLRLLNIRAARQAGARGGRE
ncbi:MAG: competence/damage-inducible protein A [Acidobacteriota bacterium]